MFKNDSAGKKYIALAYYPDKESAPAPRPQDQVDIHAQLKQYDIDRRSAFVGGLPRDISEVELHDLAGHFGQVISVSIVDKKGQNIGKREYCPQLRHWNCL